MCQNFLESWIIFHFISIHPYMDTWVAFTLRLLWKTLFWTPGYKYLFMSLLSIFCGYMELPEVELLDHMVVVFFILWRTSILFSRAAAPFYILNADILHAQPMPLIPCWVRVVWVQGPRDKDAEEEEAGVFGGQGGTYPGWPRGSKGVPGWDPSTRCWRNKEALKVLRKGRSSEGRVSLGRLFWWQHTA